MYSLYFIVDYIVSWEADGENSPLIHVKNKKGVAGIDLQSGNQALWTW